MKSSVKASLAGQNLAGLAVLLLRDGKVDEAVEAAQRAVDLDPDLPAARVVLADALVEAGRSNDAGPHSQRARELDPNALDAYAMTRANRLQFMGRMREA
jgi:Flp pilus assembly protein TadD